MSELREVFEEEFRHLLREADVKEFVFKLWKSGFLYGFESGFTTGWENGRAGLAEEGEVVASDDDAPVLLDMALDSLESEFRDE